MNPKLKLLVLGVVWLFGLCLAMAATPPNVVMLISDDQTWTDFGFMGHPEIRTPNLDRLASQGLVFPRGYVTASLCRPSLATMITGLYPHQSKIVNNYPMGTPLLDHRPYLKARTGEYWQKHLETLHLLDTILFPINFRTWHAGNFGPQVLEQAQRKGMGILALKAMANRRWPEGSERVWSKCWYEPVVTPEEASLGLRFTLSHPVTAALPPGEEKLFSMALDLARNFTPLTTEEAGRMKEKAFEAGADPILHYPSEQA